MLNEQELKDTIRNIPDYPIPGVLFRDITTLVKNPEAYHDLITTIADQLRELNVDIVIGPEARGFVIGSAAGATLTGGFDLSAIPGAQVKRRGNGDIELSVPAGFMLIVR